MPVARKSCHPSVLVLSLLSLKKLAVVTVFTAVSRVSSFEADDDAAESVSVGREKKRTQKRLSALLHHIDTGR